MNNTPRRVNLLLVSLAFGFQACASSSSMQQPTLPQLPSSSPSTGDSTQNPPSESDEAANQSSDTEQGADADRSRPAGGTQNPAAASPQLPSADNETAEGDASQPLPSDIREENDDDTVARQLREAAEAETDPVLRERLWEEYREYKKASR